MKIRIATALVAASVFGLPGSLSGQIRVRSFDSYVRNATKELWPCPTLMDQLVVIDTYYHVADNSATTYSEWWMYPRDQYGNCSRVDAYAYESWPGLGVNGYLVEEQYDQQGNLVDYREDDIEPFWTGQFLPWRRWNRTVYKANSWNPSYTEEYHTNDIVTIDLVTGGTPDVTRQRLWRLEATANDSTTGQPIAPNQITLLGKTASAASWYGDWYPNTNIAVVHKVLSDHSVVDATPIISAESVTYDVKAFPASLLIKWDNADVTDKTNVVWVGEKIHLACTLSTHIAIITNFQWTVPGRRIANWDVASDDRYGRTHALTATNGPTVQFHWVLDELGTVDVICKVRVEGETLMAKTTYEIRRPAMTWLLNPLDVVHVTNNCKPVGPAFAGFYHLTTGKALSASNVGMFYTGYMDDLKGYPSNVNYTVSCVQTLSTTIKANLEVPAGTSWIAELSGGLDSSCPYDGPWNRGQSKATSDTPRSVLEDTETYFWRTDHFLSYLMWKSERRSGSIEVPLRVAAWSWYGVAQKVNRNNPPIWRLTGWTNQRAVTGVDTAVHPMWEFIIDGSSPRENRITNNFAYPTQFD